MPESGNIVEFRMYTASTLVIILLAIVISSAGCAPKNTDGDGKPALRNGEVIEGVPFVKQKDNFCGPASLASVMEYYGDDITQGDIAANVYTPKLQGALISDMENYARDNGFRAETMNGSINELEELIDEGVPVILLVDRGKWVVSVPHYYVVYGYDRDEEVFILHTGDQSGREIKFDKLDSEWEKMNRLMLVIRK
jgi:ABC-type bacteriocin/lantibiotic exporter with double-glycine peptidase domain